MSRAATDSILAEYDRKRGAYEDFAHTVGALVKQIVAASGVVVHSVTWRCKARESLAEKVQRTGKSYQSLSDITDLAALRITTYFSDDVDKVAAIIATEFAIDIENSVDKRAALDPDRFGYQSLHYVAALSSTRSGLLENARFKGMQIEVQVRSILQHAWAEIEHDIGYKSAAGVPRDLRRRFARVAGLLELADAEFVSIREQLAVYAKSVVAEIHKDPGNVELDLVSLRALYSIDSNVKALDPMVANIMSRPLNPPNPEHVYEQFLDRLLKLGVKSVDELERLAASERQTVARFAEYWVRRDALQSHREEEEDEPLNSGVGLFYLLYVLVWRKSDHNVAADYFRSNHIGVPTPSEDLAAHLLAFPG